MTYTFIPRDNYAGRVSMSEPFHERHHMLMEKFAEGKHTMCVTATIEGTYLVVKNA